MTTEEKADEAGDEGTPRKRRLARMPDDADQSLGAQFVRARVRGGLSQEELAARAGVDQASISRVERNETATTNLVADMAAALGMRLVLQGTEQ